jgi:hypothetical protein
MAIFVLPVCCHRQSVPFSYRTPNVKLSIEYCHLLMVHCIIQPILHAELYLQSRRVQEQETREPLQTGVTYAKEMLNHSIIIALEKTCIIA